MGDEARLKALRKGGQGFGTEMELLMEDLKVQLSRLKVAVGDSFTLEGKKVSRPTNAERVKSSDSASSLGSVGSMDTYVKRKSEIEK